jgi:pimeloyl-ACP methyl ester carboxylesterase
MFSLISDLIRRHDTGRAREIFETTPAYKEALQRWPDVANSLALQFQSPQVEETAFKLERIIRDTPTPDRTQWKLIRVPTLVLASRHDPIHPFAYGETLAREIPGAELKEITAKSVSIPQHGADVQRAIETFFQSHESQLC